MTGVQMIAAERARHKVTGHTTAHDDEVCDDAELTRMALAHAAFAYWSWDNLPDAAEDEADSWWPWEKQAFQSAGSVISDLTRAGALIAAEIDRLQRLER